MLRKSFVPLFFIFSILLLLILFAGVFYRGLLDFHYFDFNNFVIFDDSKVIFVGDVMLARDVEAHMQNYGGGYPYKGVSDMFSEKVVVGNFEGAIPKQHTPTPNLSMRFSVGTTYLDFLNQAGFNYLSLANNHSYDYGKQGFYNSEKELKKHDLQPFGDAYSLDRNKVRYIEVEDVVVALVGVNLTTTDWSTEEIETLLSTASEFSDTQVVFVHWGEEYELVHNHIQETYADRFIDAGADLIVGHHPHVVQDVELRDGVPVFYSLGNFIFDQYFSEDVMEGLILETRFKKDEIFVDLMPVTTKENHTQPSVMDNEATQVFLINLAERSDPKLRESILKGKLKF